jgi:acyl-CoA thioester hydrolase
MFRERDDVLAATNEIVALQVGMTTRRGEPFPGDVAARLAAIRAAHALMPPPQRAGRTLGLDRR